MLGSVHAFMLVSMLLPMLPVFVERLAAVYVSARHRMRVQHLLGEGYASGDAAALGSRLS